MSTVPEHHDTDTTRSNRKYKAISIGQQSLWFLNKLMGPNSVYNVGYALQLNGELDIDALARSIDEIVRRHSVIRMNFKDHSGTPVGVIREELTSILKTTSLERLSEGERDSEIKNYWRAVSKAPFDLESDPLVRAQLLNLGGHEFILILNFHHSVTDEWSLDLLNTELGTLYSAFKHGQPSPLPELPYQYFDHADQQRKWLESPEAKPQIDYWKERLADLEELEIPTDYPYPENRTYQGNSLQKSLPKPIFDQLTSYGSDHRTSLFMILMAAFKVLLHRYTGADDILIGSPMTGRDLTRTDGLIGYFVNTVAFRTDLSGNPRFNELLKRVRDTSLEAFDNCQIPFEKLVEEIQPNRDSNRNPMFQVMFVYQTGKFGDIDLEGVEVEALPIERTTSGFDLSLSVQHTTDDLIIGINYSTELFSEQKIERILGHYCVLLESIAADPSQCISDLSILTEAERHRQLVEWNQTTRDFPETSCAHHVFESLAQKEPNRIALRFEGQEMTYRDLDKASNRLAHYLRQRGVENGDLVGIQFNRCFEMIVSILATLKTGGAYLPLDPSFPPERLKRIIQEANPRVILGQSQNFENLPPTEVPAVCLEDLNSTIQQQSAEPVTCSATGEDLAYVIYTSGSTGVPKGVMLPHRALLNHVLWRIESFQVNDQDCILQKTPLVFDVSVWEIFGALLSGARLVLPKTEEVQDSAYLLDLITKENVTLMALVPSQMRNLLDLEAIKTCHSLRIVNCGGEVLPPDLPQKFYSRLSARLFNGYGPTEATVGVSYWECPRQETNPLISIGKPIANTEIFILDRYQQPVPIGVTGEIYIGGKSLARGYLNRPELTEESFVSLSPGNLSERILYKSGDLARFLPDGTIEFLGRVDRQVKLRGLRIELEEIEILLRRCDGVSDAVVIVREDVPGSQYLAAYVVYKSDHPAKDTSLKEQLESQLPRNMVPNVFVTLERFPRTSTGKLDEAALPLPDSENKENQPEIVEAQTSTEKELLQIWCEVLQRDRIGILDDFFRMGGHSLHAVQIISRIKEGLGVSLPISSLFRDPTIAGLANLIEQQKVESNR